MVLTCGIVNHIADDRARAVLVTARAVGRLQYERAIDDSRQKPAAEYPLLPLSDGSASLAARIGSAGQYTQ